MNNLLRTIGSLWLKLSPRERRLAAAVGALVVLMAAFMFVRGAMSHIRMLDNSIDRIQDQIVFYHDQIARKQSVESHYARVASQHSSKWSEAEIQDRLRQELYRLAQKEPPPLGPDGIPIKTTGDSGEMIKIPSLGQGSLSLGGENFREYKLNFRIPWAERQDLFYFLERLQDSPQSLRIDHLEVNRWPLDSNVNANIDLTRIIVDGAAEEELGSAITPPGGQDAELSPSVWNGAGAELTRGQGPDGANLLDAKATKDQAEVFRVENLIPGASYDLYLDLVVTGGGSIAVADESGKNELPETEPLRADGQAYRYHLQFTAPGTGKGAVRMRVPNLRLESTQSTASIRKFVLRKVVG